MPAEIVFPLVFLHQRLDSGLVLSECLFHANLSRLGARRERSIEALSTNLEALLPKVAPGELYLRRLGTEAKGCWVVVDLAPLRGQLAWSEPVRLRFPAVVWQHGSEATLARVPGLDIEVIASDAEELDKLLAREIMAALRRDGSSMSLYTLAWRQRAVRFKVEWQPLKVKLPSLKHRAMKEQDELEEEKPSILKQVASILEPEKMSPAFEMEETVEQLADALTATRPESVLLVGPSGVGKTAALCELVRRRSDFRLGTTPFFQTSGARIVAGQCGFGMWQERCTNLVKEAAKKRAVVHLGNLIELMEVGKSEFNQTGLAGFLRPAIARGELLCVAECTPEQLPAIEREDPQLADAFRQIKIEEPDTRRGKIILNRCASDSRKSLRTVTSEAIDTVGRLHRRYATYSAFPGRPLRFLENLRRDGDQARPANSDDVLSAFTRETGLPRVLLDPKVPLAVGAVRDWFAERVIGQAEAVNLVVDLLATVKAGLTRPNRPIASLMFIGPTGVGKTEMAKSLAEFLFGSKDRLTRFDMSEYADPIAVRRLAGTALGTEGLLTARVREQPFNVLLLDEFEKAHPTFFDLLLQVLGEARLTDAGGRLADFRNTVIILTSNLGAETYQAGHPGLRSSGHNRDEAKQHFVREVEKFLRPEMFNRLDRLVPFAPLDAPTIQQIAKREWEKVLARDGIRFRGVCISASEGVVSHLAESGFDARYGARPLKRAIERELLAPVAHQMNRYSAELTLDVNIAMQAGKLAATVKPRQDYGKTVAALRVFDTEVELAHRCIRLRRLHQLLEKSSAVRDLDILVYQREQTERRFFKKQSQAKPLTTTEQVILAKLGQLREVTNEVKRQRQEAIDLEDEMLIAFHAQRSADPSLASRLTKLLADLDNLLLMIYRRGSSDPGGLTLGLFSEDKDRLFALAKAYSLLARSQSLAVTAVQFLVATSDDRNCRFEVLSPREPSGDLRRIWQRDYLLELPRGEPPKIVLKRARLEVPLARKDFHAATIGVGMHFEGVEGMLRFAGEAGLHQFQGPPSPDDRFPDDGFPDVLVNAEAGPLEGYLPPEKIERRGGIGGSPRRIYYEDRKMIIDYGLEASAPWHEDLLEPIKTFTAINMRNVLTTMLLE